MFEAAIYRKDTDHAQDQGKIGGRKRKGKSGRTRLYMRPRGWGRSQKNLMQSQMAHQRI